MKLLRSAVLFVIASTILVAFPLANAFATVGDPTLQTYFAANPIGGTPLSSTYLQSIVTAETNLLGSSSAGAAEGWQNSHTKAEFFEVLLALPITISRASASAKAFVTSACGGFGGVASSFEPVRGNPHTYQTECKSEVKKSTNPIEIVAFVKANVLDGFFGVAAPRFPLRSIDALVIRHARLIPATGAQ